jgi:hypothetical protein
MYYDWDEIIFGFVIVLVVGLMGFFIWNLCDEQAKIKTATQEVARLNNYDMKDVDVFLKTYDYSMVDFLDSKTLQNQYVKWTSSEIDGAYRQSVMAKKQAESAASNANAALGMSAASLAISVNK